MEKNVASCMPNSAQMHSTPWCYEILPHQNVEDKRELAFSLWLGCSIFVANSLLALRVRQSMIEEHALEQRSYPLEAFRLRGLLFLSSPQRSHHISSEF